MLEDFEVSRSLGAKTPSVPCAILVQVSSVFPLCLVARAKPSA